MIGLKRQFKTTSYPHGCGNSEQYTEKLYDHLNINMRSKVSYIKGHIYKTFSTRTECCLNLRIFWRHIY